MPSPEFSPIEEESPAPIELTEATQPDESLELSRPHHIRFKSPEELKAQIAAFATEAVDEFDDREHIFQNIGNLVTEEVVDKERTTTRPNYVVDEDGNFAKIDAGARVTFATADDYLSYLRSVKGSRHESVSVRAELLRNYTDFQELINSLGEEQYIGKGSNSRVYKLSYNGKDYAVRIPSHKSTAGYTIDRHVAGQVAAQGIPHLEQIVAASYESGISVSELIPGKALGGFNAAEIAAIPDEHLAGWIDTIVTAHSKDVAIDPKPSNFLYDTNKGFGVVDLQSYNVQDSMYKGSVGTKVGELGAAIQNMGTYGQEYAPKVAPEEFASELVIMVAEEKLIWRFRTLVEAKLSGSDLEEALQFIDSRIAELQKTIADYSNPNTVNEMIQRNIKYADERKQIGSNSPTDGWLNIEL